MSTAGDEMPKPDMRTLTNNLFFHDGVFMEMITDCTTRHAGDDPAYSIMRLGNICHRSAGSSCRSLLLKSLRQISVSDEIVAAVQS